MEKGFAGASARTIADRAQVNQALVFYHFESVSGLLLAALDTVSEERAARYGPAVDSASSLQNLAEVAATIFQEDLAEGHVAVLVSLLSGAASTPGLGKAIAERIKPWTDFTEDLVRRFLDELPFSSLIPAEEVAFAVVALYLGMEMLSELDGNRSRAEAIFTRAGTLANFLQVTMESGITIAKGADFE